jgi:hypothetical protein
MAHQGAVTNKSAAQRLIEQALKEFGGEVLNRKQERSGDGSEKRKAEDDEPEMEESDRPPQPSAEDQAHGEQGKAPESDAAERPAPTQRPGGKTVCGCGRF